MANYTVLDLNEFLGRPFTDLSILEKALTAPGAEGVKDGSLEERTKYEGNRTLAQIGSPLHQLAVKRLVLQGVPRSEADVRLKSSFANLEDRARSIGFYSMIRLNPRQRGIVSKNTLRLVFSAIVGAAHESYGRNESNTTDVVNRLHFNSLQENQTTSLCELEIRHKENSWDYLIDTPETPETGPSSPADNTPGPETSHSSWPLEDGLSPPVTAEVTENYDFFGSLSQQQDEMPLTPSFQQDFFGSPSQQQDEMPLTPSFQQDGMFENIVFDITDYNTLLSLELPPSTPDSSSQNASDTSIQSILNDLTVDMVPEMTVTAVTTATVTLAPSQHLVSSLESGVQNAAQTGGPICISSVSKKRRSERQEKLPQRLDDYIRLEKKRCHSTGLTFLDADLDSTTSQAIESLLLTLHFGIGSPEVFAMLQELLKTRRERFPAQQSREKHFLSPADRIIAIEREDVKMAYTCFRKRCHVYQLYVDCSSESEAATETFVTSTIQTMATRPTPQIGNPQNLELSRISDRMLSLSYPDLMPDDPSYEQKEKFTKKLRKLGQRLHLLVGKFGYGILGLIPLPSNEPSLVQALNITDEAILRIPENKFNPFVNSLDDKHGSILRAMSDAVSDVVKAIFNEEIDHQDSFAIERCNQEEIFRLPGRSLKLLYLIS